MVSLRIETLHISAGFLCKTQSLRCNIGVGNSYQYYSLIELEHTLPSLVIIPPVNPLDDYSYTPP